MVDAAGLIFHEKGHLENDLFLVLVGIPTGIQHFQVNDDQYRTLVLSIEGAETVGCGKAPPVLRELDAGLCCGLGHDM